VQRHEREVDPAIADRLEQIGGEMEAGGRRRRRTLLPREHRLITRLINEPFPDVGRRWHLANAPDFLERVGDAVEPHRRGLTMPDFHRNAQR